MFSRLIGVANGKAVYGMCQMMPERNMNDLVTEGERLVSAYLHAHEELERAKRDVTGSECSVRTAEEALAKWLMPADMKPGEKIAVWRGDSLFQVELVPRESYAVGGDEEGKVRIDHVPKVTVRKRGKHFYKLREAV